MVNLYEDQFVTLTDLTLQVHNYYCPNRRTRRINLDSIVIVYFEDQEQSKLSYTRMWGRGYGPVYWAMDVRRMFARLGSSTHGRSNVVIDMGGEDKVGFSILNIDSFMEKMREILDYHVIIVNKINL